MSASKRSETRSGGHNRARAPVPSEEEIFQRDVRRWHVELFREEYDFIYDSYADREERRRGGNPMSASYVKRVNAQRALLGFGPLLPRDCGPDGNTLAWVERMLREGRDGEMRRILYRRLATARREARERKRAEPVGGSLDEEIDRRLTTGSTPATDAAHGTEEDLAFRIMGALFTILPNSTEKPFFVQVSRLLPGRSPERYRSLYRHALDRWTEAYGY